MALYLIIEKTSLADWACKTLELPYRQHKFDQKFIVGPYNTLKECTDIRDLLAMDSIHSWKIEPAN